MQKYMKKTKKYLNQLEKYESQTGYFSCAKKVLEKSKQVKSKRDECFFETNASAVAPILCSYVLWILKKAQQKAIKRLYFLARDGQIFYKIAKEFCKKYKIDIDCRYIYCSRYSLRVPLYIIDKQEAMNFILLNGVNVTVDIVLERAGMLEEEKDEILKEINITKLESLNQLSLAGLKELREKLNNSLLFDKNAKKHSEEALMIIEKYLKQEGFLDNISYALVDSGWVGSMQKTFRMLLEKMNYHHKLQGFYFGLFENQSSENGLYYSFYFSKKKDINNAILFNNNLFECLCAANHGMTVGYKEKEKVVPIFKKFKKDILIENQQKVYMDFAKEYDFNYSKIDEFVLKKCIKKLIKILMVTPSKEELASFGEIKFSDDSTEKYMSKLAGDFKLKDYIYHLIPFKICYRVLYKGKLKCTEESFWMWATIAKLPWYSRWMFKWNNYLWQMIRNLLN